MSLKSWAMGLGLEGKLPDWIYRLIGKEISNKLDLKEDKDMADDTGTKPKWQSKTVWIAIIGVVIGAVGPLSAALGHPIVIPTWIYEILTAMGLYTARTATTDIQ